MKMMRKGLRARTAMLDAAPRWRIVAGAAIYLGAGLQLCRLFL
ncbi:MAG: hypothetical protein ACLQJR_08615 [Stellaceae bacterium]